MKKNKLKTHKGLKSRIKITKSGKVMHRRSGKRHLLSGKRRKRLRRLSGWAALPTGERRILRRQYNLI